MGKLYEGCILRNIHVNASMYTVEQKLDVWYLKTFNLCSELLRALRTYEILLAADSLSELLLLRQSMRVVMNLKAVLYILSIKIASMLTFIFKPVEPKQDMHPVYLHLIQLPTQMSEGWFILRTCFIPDDYTAFGSPSLRHITTAYTSLAVYVMTTRVPASTAVMTFGDLFFFRVHLWYFVFRFPYLLLTPLRTRPLYPPLRSLLSRNINILIPRLHLVRHQID